MRKTRISKPNERGSVMPLVMFAIILLLVTGAGLLTLGRNTRIAAARAATDVSARSAADAGLAKAVYSMNTRLETGWLIYGLPTETDHALPNCEATYTYKVTKVATITKDPGEHVDVSQFLSLEGLSGGDYIIKSVGKCGQSQKTVYGVLRLQGRGEYGVLVQDAVSLKSGTLVDGFDSSDPKKTDVELQMGTTSTKSDKVVLNKGVVVDGEILVGPGGNPDLVIKDLGAKTGDRYCMLEEVDFPVVTPPPLLYRGHIDAHDQTIKIDPGDSGLYTRIDLKRGTKPAILEVTGGDVVLHVTGDINLGEECEIKIAKGSSLNLYLDGDLNAKENAGFNNENVPPNFKLWGKSEGSQKWELNAKSEYFGQMYAPVAEVTARAKSDLYGAFTAKKFEMKSGGNLYYDGALRNTDEDDEGIRFVLKRWSES
jgi:hypothetical protein